VIRESNNTENREDDTAASHDAPESLSVKDELAK
jgi:hypothetical protein